VKFASVLMLPKTWPSVLQVSSKIVPYPVLLPEIFAFLAA
jgi:hypothetical protein